MPSQELKDALSVLPAAQDEVSNDQIKPNLEDGDPKEEGFSKSSDNNAIAAANDYNLDDAQSKMVPDKDILSGSLCRMCLMKKDHYRYNEVEGPRYKTGPTGKRIMMRMDRLQKKILMAEFDRDANWTSEKVQAIAARLSISKAKVYKWNWDQKNKRRDALFAQFITERNAAPRRPQF